MHAHDTMTVCKAYVDGTQLGYDVKIWLQERDKALKTNWSNFKSEVAKIIRFFIEHVIFEDQQSNFKYEV